MHTCPMSPFPRSATFASYLYYYVTKPHNHPILLLEFTQTCVVLQHFFASRCRLLPVSLLSWECELECLEALPLAHDWLTLPSSWPARLQSLPRPSPCAAQEWFCEIGYAQCHQRPSWCRHLAHSWCPSSQPSRHLDLHGSSHGPLCTCPPSSRHRCQPQCTSKMRLILRWIFLLQHLHVLFHLAIKPDITPTIHQPAFTLSCNVWFTLSASQPV